MTLGPLAHEVPPPTPESPAAALLFEYRAEVWSAFGRELRRMMNGSQTWGGVAHTLPAVPTAALRVRLNTTSQRGFDTPGIGSGLPAYGAVYGFGLLHVGFENHDRDNDGTDDSYRIQSYSRSGLRSLNEDRIVPYLADHVPQGLARYRSQASGEWERTDAGLVHSRLDSQGRSHSYRHFTDSNNRLDRLYARLAVYIDGAYSHRHNYAGINAREGATISGGPPWSIRYGYVLNNQLHVLIDVYEWVIATGGDRRFLSAVRGDHVRTGIYNIGRGGSIAVPNVASLSDEFLGASVVLAGTTRYYRLSNGHLAKEGTRSPYSAVDLGALPEGAAGLVANATGTELFTATQTEILRYNIARGGAWEPVASTLPTMSGVSMQGVGADGQFFVRATVDGTSDTWRYTQGAYDTARLGVLWQNTAAGDHAVRIYSSANEELVAERITIPRAQVPEPEAVAIDEENSVLYVAGSDGKVDSFSLATVGYGTRTGEVTIPGNLRLRGMTIIGGHVYSAVVSEGDSTIYKVKLSDGSIVQQRKLENRETHAVASDGMRLYLLDAAHSRVVVLNTDLQELHQRGEYLVLAHPNGITWTENGNIWTDVDTPAFLLAHWDDRIWALDYTGQLRWTTDLEEWHDDAALPLPDGAATALFVARRLGGEFMLYAATKYGLWAHNVEAMRWYSSEFEVPPDEDAGRGVDVWRESVYYGDNLGIYSYDPSGLSGAVVSVKGPDRDDGLPLEYRGKIVQLLRSHVELIVFIDATHVEGGGHLRASGWRRNVIDSDIGRSSILAWDGGAYQPLWESGVERTAIRSGLISSAYNDYRLYWSIGNKVCWMKRPRAIPNSAEVDTSEFAKRSTFISAWFDAGDIASTKTGLVLRVEASRMSDEETALFSIGYDRQEVYYELADFLITRNGAHEVHLAPRVVDPIDPDATRGAVFSAIRFKVDLERGDDPRRTPDVNVFQLSFSQDLPRRFTYAVHLDVSQKHNGLTPEEQLLQLEEMHAMGEQVRFVYQGAYAGNRRIKYVKVPGLQQAVEGGVAINGILELNLLEQ